MLETMELPLIAASGAAAIAALGVGSKLVQRVRLSLAKQPGLAGHPRMARRFAGFIPSYSYDESQMLGVDGASADVVQRRAAALERLVAEFQQRYPKSIAQTAEVVGGISDLQFVSNYRVPYQFKNMVARGLKFGAFVQAASGVSVTDLDGNVYYDLTGSYGVNVLGVDFYKECIDNGADAVRSLGPILGPYHPVVADNVQRLLGISGMNEVSFHMSGTEAVMQAVRLARYHTRRNKVLRFCGAYNGWWGDVQPGIGNPVMARDTLTLPEMSERTLNILKSRKDIACVLINPLQAMHPNKAAPGDSALLDSSRTSQFDRAAYTKWLEQLRQVCSERGVALIFDEVFLGFRLAKGGAQEFFGVQADMVTYGKTLGGGLPVGVVCGKSQWMRRFRSDAPADVCFARGTFNSHPYVMGAMNEFLKAIEKPEISALYDGLTQTWDSRAVDLNQRFRQLGLPLQVANLSTIWTVNFTKPACYNWLLQHYMRLEGLALSWVGSGRIIFSLNYSQEDFEEVEQRFIKAAIAMQQDGWWAAPEGLTNKQIRRRVLREMLRVKFHRPIA